MVTHLGGSGPDNLCPFSYSPFSFLFLFYFLCFFSPKTVSLGYPINVRTREVWKGQAILGISSQSGLREMKLLEVYFIPPPKKCLVFILSTVFYKRTSDLTHQGSASLADLRTHNPTQGTLFLEVFLSILHYVPKIYVL